MVDLNLAAKQHLDADLLAGVDAAAVEHIAGVQLLPQLQQRPVGAPVELADLRQLGRPLLRRQPVLVVLAVAALLLVIGQLQLAREFDRDLSGRAIALDQLVDGAAQLVEPDMHGRIGQPSDAPDHIRFGCVSAAGHDVAVQHLAVIGQFVEHLAGAEVAVMQPQSLDRLAVDDHAAVRVALMQQRIDQPTRDGVAEAAITLRQSRGRHAGGLFGRQRIFGSDPRAERGEFGVGLHPFQLLDHRPLFVRRQMHPARTEARLRAHHGGDLVTFQVGAVLAFLVEPRLRFQLQHLA